MKTPSLLSLLALSALHLQLSTPAAAQGSLNPPAGPPVASMKTLDQVEARTPLVAGAPRVAISAAGTNPTDRSDFLRITSLNYLPGNNAGTLRWTAVQNRAYRVEQSTDLQSWQMLATPVYAIDGAVTAATSVPKTGPQRFFRVIALKPPAGE